MDVNKREFNIKEEEVERWGGKRGKRRERVSECECVCMEGDEMRPSNAALYSLNSPSFASPLPPPAFPSPPLPSLYLLPLSRPSPRRTVCIRAVTFVFARGVYRRDAGRDKG